jgi:hypothetical protein
MYKCSGIPSCSQPPTHKEEEEEEVPPSNNVLQSTTLKLFQLLSNSPIFFNINETKPVLLMFFLMLKTGGAVGDCFV